MKSAVIFLFALLGSSLCDKVVINDAIDQLLDSGREILKAKGQDKMKIKDLDKTFEKKLFGTVTVKGEFKASGGLFQDLGSLHRTGDVTMDTQGNSLTLKASMGLSVLEISFAQYSFNMLAIHSTGSMKASCADNAVSASVKLTYSGAECKAEVLSAQIDRLGKFNVAMTGPGSLNELGSVLLNWVMNHFNENIRSLVNNRLKSSLSEALKSKNLCKMIPPPS